LEIEIKRLEKSIEAKTSLYQETYDKLIKNPGVSHVCATVILSEIGDNVKAFKNVKHLASWVGLCPGSYESASVVKSSHVTKGNKYLKEALYHAGRAATHSNSAKFNQFYERICAKGSAQKAIVACAHKVLRIVYKVLDEGIEFEER